MQEREKRAFDVERAFSIDCWSKILIEMGYSDEQIDTLLTEYYADNWKENL